MIDTSELERIIIRGVLKGYDTRRLMATLTVNHFETVQMRQIFNSITEYYDKFNEVPQVDILVNELRKQKLDKAEVGHMEAFLTKKQDITDDKIKYSYEEIEKAYISRSLRTSMKEAIIHLDKGDVRMAQDTLMKDAVKLSSHGRDIKVVDFASDYCERKEALIKRKDNPDINREILIPTGIQKLDYELDGGLRKGELGLFLAPPESGKSISLQDIAMSAVLMNYKVVLFTIEMTAQQTAYRLDSRLTQIRYRKFRRATLEEDDLKRWEEQIQRVKVNRFKIISVPEGCSCRVIEAELSRIAGMFQPDIILVDYAGIMSPNEGRYESSMDWKYIGAVVRNLKGLALKLNIPVWSASQLLVGAKEKAEVKFTDVGLARQQIAAHADVCIAIIQTQQMRAMDTTKLQFVKIREGCDNKFIEIQSDYDRISLSRRVGTGQEGSEPEDE